MNRTRWLHVALVVYTLGVLVYRDALMDDTFIHLQYARNLREAGEISFNRGEPSLGLTSPLWLLLLAVLGGEVQVARMTSVACGALAVWVFGLLARRLLGGGAFAAAATVAWAGSLWLVRHAPNGMETAAAVLLVLLAVDLRARSGRHAWRDVGFGVTLAAACLARPEAALLAAVYALDDLRSEWGRVRLRSWVPACALLAAAWFLFVKWKTGQLLPETASAKSGVFELDVATWVRVLWRQARIAAAAHAIELLGMLLALGVALRAHGAAALRRLLGHRLVPYGVFAGALVAAFALADVQVQPRYLVPVLPFLTLAGFAAWRSLLGDGPRAAGVVCVLCLAVGAGSSAVRVYTATRDFSTGLQTALLPLAGDVRARAAAGTCVATPDIGVIGYYGGTRVLDLGGLIEPRIQGIVRAVGYDSMLAQGAFLDFCDVGFVIDRSVTRERFRDHVTRGLRWTPLRTTMIRNLGLSRPGPYYYTLYALEAQTRAAGSPPSPTFHRRAYP